MSHEFTIDILEEKKARLFITGLSLTDLAIADSFTVLNQYGNSKKSKKQLTTIDLTIESIIVDGEPVESIASQQPAMIVLSGDYQAVLDHADTLRWRKKSGRLIRTSDEALTIADS